MAQETTTTAAEQYKNMDEQSQNDHEHEAWTAAIEDFRADHPDGYDRIESSSKVSWGDMYLEVYQDENDRDYFHIVTGVQCAPGRAGEDLSESVHELMQRYRDELTARINGDGE